MKIVFYVSAICALFTMFSCEKKTNDWETVVNEFPDHFLDIHGYHSVCYNNFTAYKSNVSLGDSEEVVIDKNNDRDTPPKLRSQTPTLSTDTGASSTGLFPKECIICNKYRKRKPKGSKGPLYSFPMKCESYEAADKIKDAAKSKYEYQHLDVKINGIDFMAKEVKYHSRCQKNMVRYTRGQACKKKKISKG